MGSTDHALFSGSNWLDALGLEQPEPPSQDQLPNPMRDNPLDSWLSSPHPSQQNVAAPGNQLDSDIRS